ncbi:deoxyuridine 5'-triphosphate nucleotidohydrolase [bacterium]|nr:deoxyuridine 5'-triphosphate nucleotidohydrolase [bacterium]
MERIAKFEKIKMNDKNKEYYDDIMLPKRATQGSAGYDFYIPYDLIIKPHESVAIETNIRCKMREDYVLFLFPRSSLGRKYKLTLDNTCGVVDSDYYNADNEGHIILFVTNHSENTLSLTKNDRIVQGIFLKYGITEDDDIKIERKGGYGSTGK